MKKPAPNRFAEADRFIHHVPWQYHTNTIEGAWSHFKLSIRAIYIGVSPKHLQKYCAEYEYRYNTRELKDDERLDKWFGHVNVKNLRYKDLTGVGRLMLAPVYPTREAWM